MELLVFGLATIAMLLFAVLVSATVIWFRFGDSTAAYPLFKVRDDLIDAVVFRGVSTDDPWFKYLYQATNLVLTYCNVVKGPEEGWKRGKAIGVRLGTDQQPETTSTIATPITEPPDAIVPIIRELDRGLLHLEQHHVGHRITMGTAKREWIRRQRQEARALRGFLANSRHSICSA